jgi:predicted dinucleotide-binding enzyme
MKLSIIGAGHIGGNLARLLVKTGNDVALANSRGPSSLRGFVYELGGQLHPIDPDGAVAYSDLIIVAIQWRNLGLLPVFKVPGKIIVDTTNPYKEDGSFFDLGDDISSVRVIEHFPGGKIVKAFNTIWYKHLAETGNINLPLQERRAIPLCGDDKDAKEKVSQLIQEIGFGPVDTGNLLEGTKIQGINGVLYNRVLTVKETESVLKDLHWTY